MTSVDSRDENLWLEDIYGDEPLAWVASQNALTAAALDSEATDAPVDGVTEGDTAVAKFIFRRPLSELPAITATSRLEAAVIGHLAAGRHWRERAGVIEFR